VDFFVTAFFYFFTSGERRRRKDFAFGPACLRLVNLLNINIKAIEINLFSKMIGTALAGRPPTRLPASGECARKNSPKGID